MESPLIDWSKTWTFGSSCLCGELFLIWYLIEVKSQLEFESLGVKSYSWFEKWTYTQILTDIYVDTGRNPNYSNVLTNNLQLLKWKCQASLWLKTWRQWTMPEMLSFKLNAPRSLRHKIRSCNDPFFENGDKVYYKRSNNPKWKGPGCVTGQEGKSILVKHGSEYVRVTQRA